MYTLDSFTVQHSWKILDRSTLEYEQTSAESIA